MRINLAQEQTKLQFFKDLYEEALTAAKGQIIELEKYIEQYKGSKKLDAIDGEQAPADAIQVRNFTYELIESQTASYIPRSVVTPEMFSERNERNAKSIETLLRNKRDKLPFETMNDIDERYNPIYGGSVWFVEWDDSIKTHHTVGDVKVSCLSPRHFVGQPNIYSVDDMEYLFITFETTKENIERKYHVSLAVAEAAETEDNEDDKTATLYVCYYRNEDRRICQYIWSADTEILDLEDFYSRKRKVCSICGRREELCECEKPKLVLQDEEYEVLDHDIPLSEAGQYIPAMSPVYDESGQPVMETVEQNVTLPNGEVFMDYVNGVMIPVKQPVQVQKTEPTKLPYYTPDTFPVVIRKNISQEDSLFGQSDCEAIRDQQQGANKIESRIMEKLMRAGVFPIVPDDFSEQTLDNSVYEKIYKAKQSNYMLYGKLDLQVDIARDIAESDRLYDQAKRILGISDSFQGQYDASAQSGVAKQVQVAQSNGRLDSKRKMKNAAYADIDKIIFQYYLAYADEPRPATFVDSFGKKQNITFNRYDFLECDAFGKYYYNDEYLFSTDSTLDIERSRETLWQENRQNFREGTYGDPRLPETLLMYWQNMESAHYPYAADNVARIKALIEKQQQDAAIQNNIAKLQSEVQNRQGYESYLQDLIKKSAQGGGNNGGLV